MAILVLFFPFLSFTLLFFFGRFIGREGSSLIAISFLAGSFLLSLVYFCEIVLSRASLNFLFGPWFIFGALSQFWSFTFDSATGTMLLVVLSVSFLVHLYSVSYMSTDPYLIRFISYLSLFTFFMLVFITSGNCLQMFLGWEGVGLSSYLLINFWYTRLPANKSAIKAVVVNRFGDFALIGVLMAVYSIFRSFDYGLIFGLAYAFKDLYVTVLFWEIHSLSLIASLLFIGCVGKSAQLGLHTWLPDAMEGPTPVSALIHAATMVTAGVFLLIRFSPLLELTNLVLPVICLIGGATAFFAATVGVFQNDLKRVIAYSTCSQLGYMVLACGLSQYSVALFHLMNHAFFKALLFLSAGAVIHAVADEQDMRRMGGLLRLLPLTYVCFLVGSLALAGFPFTTGFYSKDLILELLYSNRFPFSIVVFYLALLAALCTAFYSFRLIYLVFIGESNLKRPLLTTVHEPDVLMATPLVILGFAAIFVGYFLRDAFVGLGTPVFDSVAQKGNRFIEESLLLSEFYFASNKAAPVLFSLFFALLSVYTYEVLSHWLQVSKIGFSFFSFSTTLVRFFNKKWYFDTVYNNYVVLPALSFGNNYTFKNLDRGLIELFGPTGLVRFWLGFSSLFRNLQSGFIFNYVFFMVIAVVLLLLSRYAFHLESALFPFSFLFVFSSLLPLFRTK